MDPEIEDYHYDSDFEPHKNILQFLSLGFSEMAEEATDCVNKMEELMFDSETLKKEKSE